MDVAQLAPHAGLSSDHFDTLDSGVELVQISPFYVISIGYPVSIAEPLIDVGVIVGGKNYLIRFVCE